MSQRERFLAIAVAVVVALFGVQYMFNKVSRTLAEKQDAVDAVRSASSDLDKIATSGKIAVRKIEKLQKMSLPRDQERLVAEYGDWLTDLGDDLGLKELSISVPQKPDKTTEAYTSYNFALSGVCPTDKAVELVGRFYDKNYLHRITNLRITPSPRESNVVKVDLEAQALALSSAAPDQEPSPEPSGRLAMSIDEYKKIILDRNPFSPPNEPPRIITTKSQSITRGQSWSLDLDAEDPESSRVEWELASTELPDGLRLQGNSLSWKPDENGEYEVEVRAHDRGWPNRYADLKLVLTVKDPEEKPAEKPAFDAASQAFVSALISGSNGPQVWIRSRTDGNTLYLNEGSDFELGTIKAKVVSIHPSENFAEFETQGKHWTIGMDKSLAQAYAESQID